MNATRTGLNPETKEHTNVKTNEIQVKSGIQLIIFQKDFFKWL